MVQQGTSGLGYEFVGSHSGVVRHWREVGAIVVADCRFKWAGRGNRLHMGGERGVGVEDCCFMMHG